MITRYFTFGQNHIHRIGELILDRDIVVKITAADEEKCRQKMFATFGDRWGMEYDNPPEPRWFPRGVVEI